MKPTLFRSKRWGAKALPSLLFGTLITVFCFSSYSAVSQVNSITAVLASPVEICAGNDISVQFNSSATGTNTYTLSLSDENGAFPGINTINVDLDGDQNGVTVLLSVPAGAVAGSN